MIHPGTGGCEVYISLASALVKNFSCYGVDSYNLYHENKINDLHSLAKYYLSYIDEIMLSTHQNEYHLLGWSLGGLIALKIACILEQRNSTIKIRVYLLDSMGIDNYMLSLINDVNIEYSKNEYRAYAALRGYDKLYIEKAISNMDTESKLARQKLSSILNNTHILLFKAMLEDTRIEKNNSKELLKYLSSLEYNNFDKMLADKSNIKLIKIHNACHGDILLQEDLLVSEILSFQCTNQDGVLKKYNGPKNLDKVSLLR
jgi:pimeloyl-ACP methyl ester carboxylesterase